MKGIERQIANESFNRESEESLRVRVAEFSRRKREQLEALKEVIEPEFDGVHYLSSQRVFANGYSSRSVADSVDCVVSTCGVVLSKVASAEEHTLSANREDLEKLLGYSSGEIKGQKATDLFVVLGRSAPVARENHGQSLVAGIQGVTKATHGALAFYELESLRGGLTKPLREAEYRAGYRSVVYKSAMQPNVSEGELRLRQVFGWASQQGQCSEMLVEAVPLERR